MRLILLLLYLSYTTVVSALDNFTVQLGTIAGKGWQMHDITLQLQGLNREKLALNINIARFESVLLKKSLTALQFQCLAGQYAAHKISCSQAMLQVSDSLLDEPTIKFAFTYDTLQQRLYLKVQRFALAGGHITIQSKAVAEGWSIKLNIQQVSLQQCLTKLKTLIALPETLTLAGQLTFTAEITGAKTVQKINLVGQLKGVNFSSAKGTQAMEGLTGKMVIQARQTTDSWQGRMSLTVEQGEIYSEPFYLAIITQQPIAVTADFSWQSEQLEIHHFIYTHTEIFVLKGFCTITLTKAQVTLTQLIIELPQTALAKVYQHYLQSWVNNDLLKQLRLSGLISARLEWGNENRYLRVKCYEVSLENKDKAFGLGRLNGTLQWHNRLKNLPSQLKWAKAYIASLDLKGSQLNFNLNGNNITLLTPFQQPILGGALHIQQFQLIDLGQPQMQFELIGGLTPISLTQLTTTFDLPLLKGQISAKIPGLHYEKAKLTMTDTLQFQLFNGNVSVTRLQIKDPFSGISTLQADIDIEKLDLQTLTKVTDFGEIQGDLSGYIHHLELVDWIPVAFDAQFNTPPGSIKPQRISQRAIDNLSNLNGGGAVNTVSKNFLRLFEDFSYQSLGLGCRLQQGVCEMWGIAPASKGYYIIKGGGLPRVDVIGYNQRVDWTVLINRLKNINYATEPVIE